MSDGLEHDSRTHLIQFLGEYAAIDGVAGHEHAIVERLVADLTPHVDEIDVDPFGNIVATKRGPDAAPSLMIAAHSDEIGAAVKAVDLDGMIRFERIGGVVESLLVGRAVTIRGHAGVVGCRPGHLTPAAERLSVPQMRELYIDLGFDTAAEVHALGVGVGDAIVYDAPMRAFANPNRFSGKALDNRVGCTIVVELARRLKDVTLGCELHLVVTVQEEVGLRGARMVTHRLNPTAAIIVDTMPAGGTPDTSSTKDLAARMGQGPVLTLASQGGNAGMIAQPGFRDFLVGLAEREGIGYQPSLFYGGNSDAAVVHLVNAGVPTAAINIARRYSHSPVETLDIGDALGALRWSEVAARSFSGETDLSFLASRWG